MEQINHFAKKLDDAMEENRETMLAHVEYVKETEYQREMEVSSGDCPFCDGYLILRHGKYGEFYGCSNYPRCKFTKKV